MNIPDKIADLDNNCTLRAVKEVSRLDDKVILDAFLKHGYKPNAGMTHDKWTAAAKDLGLKMEEVETTKDNIHYITLAEFVRSYPIGTYFVSVHAHALVVRDSKIIDNPGSLGYRRRVRRAKRVLNAPALERIIATKLAVHISPDRAKRRGTESYKRYVAMVNYISTNPAAKPSEIFKATIYTDADFNHDLKKGLIGYV